MRKVPSEQECWKKYKGGKKKQKSKKKRMRMEEFEGAKMEG